MDNKLKPPFKNKDKDKFKVAQEGYQIESQAAQIVMNQTH